MNKAFSTLILGVLIGAGCETQKKAPPPPPPSKVMDAATLESLRQHFRAENADIVVAGVSEVLPADDFLAVRDVDLGDFAAGTSVSVIDSNRNTLAHGNVVKIDNGEVQIAFTTTGVRRPQVGDAVIPFPKKK